MLFNKNLFRIILLVIISSNAYSVSYIARIINNTNVHINVSCAHGSGVDLAPGENHHVFSLNCPTGGSPIILNGLYNAASIVKDTDHNTVLGYVVDSGNKSINTLNAGWIFYTLNAANIALQQSYIDGVWLQITVSSSNPYSNDLSVIAD